MLHDRIDEQRELPGQLDELRHRLDEHDGVASRVDEIGAALASTDAISDQLRELTKRAGSTQAATDETRAQLAAVEQRLASASTELANQIGELGREIDGLATRELEPVNVTLDDAATATLRNGQVRLASEQARFEISFREDLATLAEQVRQLRGRG